MFLAQQISILAMSSEGSCDTEDWSIMMLKIQLCIDKLHSKYVKKGNLLKIIINNTISQYYFLYFALVS